MRLPAQITPEFLADSAESTSPPPLVLRVPSRWRGLDLAELWRFRELLGFLVWRDVLVRYQQTLLGVAWAVLQPALMMIVFTLFFSHMGGVSSGKLPYSLFAYAGILPWTFFSTAIASAAQSVVGSERLITKVYFPRLAIPLAAVFAAAVDFAVGLVLLAGLLIWNGVVPNSSLFVAPLILLPLVFAAAGVGAFLAALNVAYRDVRYVIGFALQLWMFATPVIYMQTQGRALLAINPLNALIGNFRACVTGGAIEFRSLAIAAVSCVVLFFLGCFYFRKVEDTFADVI